MGTQFEDLLAACEAASTRFQHGDDTAMRELYSDTEDVTLFGALGGCARGKQAVEQVLRGAAANLGKGGTVRYEVVSMAVEKTMAYFTGIQHIEPAAEGLAVLRVTNIFRLEDGQWRLLHRHADVLRDSPFA